MPDSIFLIPGVGAQGGLGGRPRARPFAGARRRRWSPRRARLRAPTIRPPPRPSSRDQVWAVSQSAPVNAMQPANGALECLRFSRRWKASRERRPSNWTARILAPLALVVVALVVITMIATSLGSDDSGDAGADGGAKQTSTTTSGCSPAADQAVKDGYYVVQTEDVQGLSGIAAQDLHPVDRLSKLNPNLDPQLLQVSNCIDLVPTAARSSPRAERAEGRQVLAGPDRRGPRRARCSPPRRRRPAPPMARSYPPAPGSSSTPVTTQVLAAQRPNEERAIASTTKLMTAYARAPGAAARQDGGRRPPTRRASPSRSSVSRRGSESRSATCSTGCCSSPATTPPWRSPSGSAGIEAAFVREMNQAAQQLGLEHTSLREPDRARRARQLLERPRPGRRWRCGCARDPFFRRDRRHRADGDPQRRARRARSSTATRWSARCPGSTG